MTEPILNMMGQFIFTGDFDDPFQEFFVEKLYKKHSSEYVLKMKGNPMETIPCFFFDIA